MSGHRLFFLVRSERVQCLSCLCCSQRLRRRRRGEGVEGGGPGKKKNTSARDEQQLASRRFGSCAVTTGPSLPIGIYLRAVEGIRSSNLGAFANKHVSILSLFIEANKPAKPLAKAFPSWASGSVALYWWGGKKNMQTHRKSCVLYFWHQLKKKKKEKENMSLGHSTRKRVCWTVKITFS